MSEMAITAQKTFRPTASLPLVRYCLDKMLENSKPCVKYGSHCRAHTHLHDQRTYEYKRQRYDKRSSADVPSWDVGRPRSTFHRSNGGK